MPSIKAGGKSIQPAGFRGSAFTCAVFIKRRQSLPEENIPLVPTFQMKSKEYVKIFGDDHQRGRQTDDPPESSSLLEETDQKLPPGCLSQNPPADFTGNQPARRPLRPCLSCATRCRFTPVSIISVSNFRARSLIILLKIAAISTNP